MPTKKFKPTTPSRRHMTVPTFEEITKFTPEKSLVLEIFRCEVGNEVTSWLRADSAVKIP